MKNSSVKETKIQQKLGTVFYLSRRLRLAVNVGRKVRA